MSDPTTGRPASLKYRAHTAGLDPDYWYPAAQIADLRPGSVKEVVFWKTSIALYRDADGSFHALENRCAHRHLRLSEGKVAGPHLVCRYHGWSYDGTGRLAHVSHEITGRRLPKICVASYPVREKYGLVWIFPGDRARAEAVPLPAIHELDDGQPCEVMPIVMTLRSHHAMIVENVCDFNHEMLHEGFHPFAGQKLTRNERVGDTIHVGYDTTVGTHGIVSYFTGGERSGTIRLWYQYPYQGSNTDDRYIHWLFNRPIDESTTECFFLFLFRAVHLPVVHRPLPAWLWKPILKMAEYTYVRPLLAQDKWALEEEQRCFEVHGDRPSAELNPIVPAFRTLTVEKWNEHLRRREAPRDDDADAVSDASSEIEPAAHTSL